MEVKKEKIGAWFITALLIGSILILVLPLLFGAGYTYPAADDFIAESGSLHLSEELGYFRGPLCAAWNYFMDWQGAYTTNILLFCIMPFTRWGLSGFRVCMVMISFLFPASLYFMVSAVINFSQSSEGISDMHSRQNKKLFLYVVLLFAALGLPGTWIGKEVFYWYTATLGYLAGIISLFFSIGCLLIAKSSEKNKGYYACSMLLGFIASGTSPQVASFVCSWLLLVLLTMVLSAERGLKSLCFLDISPFLTSFCGAVINVAAPGSLRRSQSTMGEVDYSLVDALIDTLKVQKEEFIRIWYDPVFIALTIILFLVCICFEVRVVRRKRALTWMGVLLVLGGVLVSNYLCIFPVVLGYHGGGLSNDRTRYVADFEIRFSILFAVMYIAQYLLQLILEKGKWKRSFRLIGILCGLLVCMVSFWLLNDRPEEIISGYSFELIKEISNGTTQEVFNLRKAVLDALEAAEDGTDVYLKMPEIPSTRVTYPQGIVTEADYQVNRDVAYLFHLNSVVVEYGIR